MRYLVYDIAASESGALNVLNDFYTDILNNDNLNEWIFIVSVQNLRNDKHIKVISLPWTKKSWLHRIYFENFKLNNLIKKENIDVIISLQNTAVPHTKVKQYVYMHNSIPFVDYKFKLIENKLLWVYQNIISKVIFKSLKKADFVVVQANWLKKKCISLLGIPPERIEVVPPTINVQFTTLFQKDDPNTYKTFFYPATAFEYKNHMCILQALELIPTKQRKLLKIYFTLSGDENKYSQYLLEYATKHELPVYFIGKIKRDDVMELYSKSILLFPSFVESSPLPLSEAKICQSIVFASNLDYAHDILENYENSYFFNPNDIIQLSKLMIKINSNMYISNKTRNNLNLHQSLLKIILAQTQN